MKDLKVKENKEKNHFFHKLTLRGVKLCNALLMTIPFIVAWYLIFADKIAAPYFRKGNWAIVAVFLVLYVYFGRVNSAFLVSYHRIQEMIYSQVISVFMADGIMYIVIWLLLKRLPSIPVFISMLLVQVAISFVWAVIAHWWYFRTFPPKRTAIVWDMRRGLQALINSYGLSKKFDVVAKPSAKECVADLDMLRGMDAVFLTGVHSSDRNKIIKYCVKNDITTFIIPRIGDTLMSGARPMHMFHLPFLQLDRYNPSPEYLFVKRAVDIILSAVALIILCPLMVVVGLIIHFQDGGPAFYKQTRLTKDGKEFDVIKFRSMRMDAEKDGVARLSTKNDDRITPIGKFIRATRIDELPQLINVLKGDMSVVGPRPERPQIHKEYCEKMPDFDLRLQAKAGVTGYAQIYGKYNTTPYDKLQMDLMYMANPSIVQDINIFLTTIKILFLPESTEGIEEGTTIAGEVTDEEAFAEDE